MAYIPLSSGKSPASKSHLTEFFDTKIVNTSRDGSRVEVSNAEGHRWCGHTLVFATGCKDIFPAIERHKENWPQNMYAPDAH